MPASCNRGGAVPCVARIAGALADPVSEHGEALKSADVMMGHGYGVVGGCDSCAVRLCVCENSDGRLIAWVC